MSTGSRKDKPKKATFVYSTPIPGSDLVHAGRQLVQHKPKPNTPWERERATKAVAHHATSVEDCRELLAMLGLPDGQTESAMRSSQPGRKQHSR